MKKWFTDNINFWKVMKICVVQSAIAMVLAGFSLAHDANSQLLDKKVTLNLKDVTLEVALRQIENETKVKFVYSEDQLNLEERISLITDKESLGELLEDLLTPRRIKFKVHEKELAITLRSMAKDFLSKDNYKADTKRFLETITGIVTGGNPPQPLAGVNVLIKGTTVGTTTDSEGKFTIPADDKDALIFSFIGFVSYETQVSGRTIIDVVLQEDSKNLNEVVVNAGYWTVKDKEQTGNIARITSDEIKTQPISNPLQAMAGRMAGVMVTQETGVAGGGIQVQIRGRNSISNGNDPLYIIDGIPVISTSLKSQFFGATLGAGSPFSTINPNDIESIEVLKDGAATAIYGSRGANGVILITTKKGTSGKTKFDLSFSTGFSQVASKMNVLNTPEYLKMRREAFKNDNITPTSSNAYDLILWDTTRNTDWQKKLLGKTARVANLNASVSGGDKQTQFLFSAGYYKESTVFPGEFGLERATGSLNLNHRSLSEKFKMAMSVNYQLEDNQLFNGDLTNTSMTTSPDAPEPYVNGKINWGPSNTFSNPFANLLKKYNVSTNNFRINSQLGYDILPNLQFKTNLGYTLIQTDSYSSSPASSVLGGTTSSANFGFGQNATWIVEPQLEFKKRLSENTFSVLIGTTFQNSLRKTSSIRGGGYTNEQLLDNLQSAPTITINDATTTQYRYAALFGRINYTVKEKYIFDFIGRRDGSSRFGPDNRFANFGSVSSAWIFSSEDFIRTNLRFLNFGKIRASLGTSGNDQIGDYGYLDTYSSTRVYQGTAGLSPTRLANPNYSWETNTKFEAGLEVGVLNDRFFTSISYYQNRSSNQLVGLPLSSVTGFSTIQANLSATVENSGWEIEFNSVNIKGTEFTWTSGVNFSLPKNKLVEYQNLEGSSYANRYVVGQPITIEKVYKFQGVDPQLGQYQFQDVDGNSSITSPADNQTLINLAPTFFGGLSNSLKFRNWTLSFLFQFVRQMGPNYLGSFSMPGFLINQPEDVMQRWRSPGDISSVQKFSQTTASTYTAFTNAVRSDLNYNDASYVRLKNVALTYLLPKKWLSAVKMQGGEIFIQGQNLLTFTNYKGLDPETRSFINLPPLKTISVGVHITF